MVSRGEKVTQAEVNNLDVACLADENILDLEISVHDTVSVAVIESAGDLATKLPGLFLLQFSVRYDIIEHLPAVDIFK